MSQDLKALDPGDLKERFFVLMARCPLEASFQVETLRRNPNDALAFGKLHDLLSGAEAWDLLADITELIGDSQKDRRARLSTYLRAAGIWKSKQRDAKGAKRCVDKAAGIIKGSLDGLRELVDFLRGQGDAVHAVATIANNIDTLKVQRDRAVLWLDSAKLRWQQLGDKEGALLDLERAEKEIPGFEEIVAIAQLILGEGPDLDAFLAKLRPGLPSATAPEPAAAPPAVESSPPGEITSGWDQDTEFD